MPRAAVSASQVRPAKPPGRPRVYSYSIAQASVITQVSQKAINQYLDRELEFAAAIGPGYRAVRHDCLLAVRLNYELSSLLKDTARVDAIKAAVASSRRKSIDVPGGQIAIRIDLARSIVTSGLNKFRRAVDMVSSIPDVLGGEPCISGTRLSVYVLHGLYRACGREEVKDTYPDLTDPQLDAAIAYAEMFPRKGRPRSVGARLEKAQPHRSRVVRVKLPA